MSDSPARRVVVPALLAALLAASAWVSVPLGAVPFTLQVFIVVLCALLLTPGQTTAALGVYLALGAIGAPVFSGGQGGLGVLLGPTGGYLVGFFVGAAAGSATRRALARHDRGGVRADAAAAAVTLLVVYSCGWLQLALVTGLSAVEAFAAGVAPFLVLDVAKAAAAVGVARALRRSGVIDDSAASAADDAPAWAGGRR